MRSAARPASDCWKVVRATRVVSTVPSARTTALCPPLRGGASMTSTELPFCQTRTPVTRTQLSGCVSVISSCTWQFGTTMMRLRASAAVPTPSASALASRVARIRPGTALNLLVGKKPGSVVDWTASGASSLKSSLSLASGVVSLAGRPSQSRRSLASSGGSPGSG